LPPFSFRIGKKMPAGAPANAGRLAFQRDPQAFPTMTVSYADPSRRR
jgi:hypothetical protein